MKSMICCIINIYFTNTLLYLSIFFNVIPVPLTTALSGSSAINTGKSVFFEIVSALLGDENVALDFGSYKTAPAGFRIWASGLIEKSDIEALIPWLDWAYNTKIQEIQNA